MSRPSYGSVLARVGFIMLLLGLALIGLIAVVLRFVC